MRRFNTTGTCFPDEHYMVDISEQVNIAEQMVMDNYYFCINKGRQYGKTTTLYALGNQLESHGFTVFSLSFEGMTESDFETTENLYASFVSQMGSEIRYRNVKNIDENGKNVLLPFRDCKELSKKELSDIIFDLCIDNPKVVVIIDEVDQASNYDSFIKFLGFLRDRYLNRKKEPTFLSVILAGVYDIKNLKLKIRPESEHQYNSPWNIAKIYNASMGLPESGIAQMLSEFKVDYQLDFNENEVANAIFGWTNGYPYLVSRICEFIQANNLSWTEEGVNIAVRDILKDRKDVLFSDITKKLNDFPKLRGKLETILYKGTRLNYNPDEENLQLGFMFDFLAEGEKGGVVVSNRMFETRIYNYLIERDNESDIYSRGAQDSNGFIVNGELDLKKILEKFSYHYNKIFNHDDELFIESQGRKMFLLYLRPIINGIGNYYIEAQTRDNTRTDIVIDYQGRQFVIELKIWHGEEYNRKGEIQLSEYLDHFGLSEGYMLSFCFNKNKETGLQKKEFGDKVLWEVVV